MIRLGRYRHFKGGEYEVVGIAEKGKTYTYNGTAWA